MLDIKKIKENPDAVKAGLKAKEVDCDATVDRILELDERIRALKTASEGKTAQKNKLSKENGKLFGQKKKAERRAPTPPPLRPPSPPTMPRVSSWTRMLPMSSGNWASCRRSTAPPC